MGSGRYSSAVYSAISSERDYATKSRDEIFSHSLERGLHASSFNRSVRTYNKVDEKMLEVGVRECRDSDEHPNTTPIIIALDVTGSMLQTPHEMIKDQLPKLMEKLIQLDVPDPQLLFMAVGDHVYDSYPIQVGQFESDTEKILDSLQKLVIEGGGGPNYGESYLLAWLMAGYHTEIDSWFKRNKKGFLFTIGDEPTLDRVEKEYLVDKLGYQKGVEDMSVNSILPKAKEQYHVFHIHIDNASKRLVEDWEDYLPGHILRSRSSDIAGAIASAIQKELNESND